ncbi:MAG TPA: hypothetical protein VHH57_02770 [Gaiella sp.]|nr:hypothetical protein [Gaiella sp.]
MPLNDGAQTATGGGAPQGESVATWALWALLLVVLVATYARLEPAELYSVSRDGLYGGLSRAVVELNFPVSLVAIALVLVASDALPRRAWWVAAPAIGLCAVTAFPGVVNQDDLDARWVNGIPTVGVALALGLTAAAARRAGTGPAPRLPLDLVRVAIFAVALVVSIPWFAAELGFFLPEGVFIMDRPGIEPNGTTIAAVHLGHHHGLDGTVIVLSALLLSRPRLHTRGLARATRAYLSLAFAYGAINLAEDLWHEQVVKRDWVEWRIPSALHPTVEPMWLVILGLAAATAFVLRAEGR